LKPNRPHVSWILLGTLALLPSILLTAHDQDKRPPADVPGLGEINLPATEMRGWLERYSADRAALARSYPVAQSAAGRDRFKRFYAGWQGFLAEQDFESMSLAGQVEFLLFRNLLDYELRQLDFQAGLSAETEVLIPFEKTVTDLEEARRRMEWADPQKAAEALHELNKQVAAVRKSVETTIKPVSETDGSPAQDRKPFKKTVANRAAARIDGMRDTLRSWYRFYHGYDPLFTWWADSPYQTLDRSLQDYAAFLRERIVGLKPVPDDAGQQTITERAAPDARPGGGSGGASGRTRSAVAAAARAQPGSSEDIIGDPIGRDALLSALAREMIPYTPEELIEIAEKEFEWCESEMKKASRAMGYGDDWHKALEHVKSLYVEPGKQPELIRELAVEAIRYLEDHDLITVPELAGESWRIEMMSPERQLVNPFFTGGETISVSYPTDAMSFEQKMMSMRGNNIHFARATVFHELIPGHHLSGFMTARYRPYRGLFSTSFWGEGWAVYWEMLLYQMNFPKTPENRVGMLFWRSHRCARIIFSLGFHLGKMTPQECIDLLVKRVGHEVENATAEVRRSFGTGYGPLYQAGYMVGALQFMALHRELVDSGRMTNREFHDAILRENSMPLEMVRALLTRQKLTRDHSASWKFYSSSR